MERGVAEWKEIREEKWQRGTGDVVSWEVKEHYHKDNLRHIPRFPGFFVTFRILVTRLAPSCRAPSLSVHPHPPFRHEPEALRAEGEWEEWGAGVSDVDPPNLPRLTTRSPYQDSYSPLLPEFPDSCSRLFPSFTHSSHPAAVRSSLKASSHGVNDGWRKRKETTHGESERETDERLDQDMRKDDEEPRAAREWGSRSISPVNRSSTSHFCHSCRSPLSYVRRVLATFIPSVRRMRGNRASGGRMGIWGEKPTRRKEECWASLGGSSV